MRRTLRRTAAITSPTYAVTLQAEPRALGIVDALTLALPIALCLGHGWSLFYFSSFTPRMALLIAAGIPGLVVLCRLAFRRDATAIAAAALVLWAIVASGFTDATRIALFGTVGRESSAAVLMLGLGVWALGRASSRRVVELMPLSVLIGLVVNAVVGFAQVVLQVDSGPFALQYSRATGLTPNPVYFGALAGAGAALAAAVHGIGLPARVAMVSFLAMATELSGSRVASLAGLVAVLGWSLIGLRDSDVVRKLVGPLSYVLGVAVGVIVTTATGGQSATGRIVQDGGGRLTAWRYAAEAVADRPVFGWGLGRFRAATQGRFSPDFVRSTATDDLRQAWFDPHNILLEVAVGVGVVGLAAAVVWVVLASRRVGGPFAPALVVIGLVVMLQPLGLALFPMGMLLLGTGSFDRERPDRRDVPSRSVLLALLVGSGVAGWLAVADLRFGPAAEQVDPVRMENAAAWFPRDAVVADLVAQAWFIAEEFDPSLRPSVIEWSERAISAEPDRPYLRAQYASRLVAFGEYAAAREQIDSALALQPWHVRSWYVAYVLGERDEDPELRVRAAAALCSLGQPLDECGT